MLNGNKIIIPIAFGVPILLGILFSVLRGLGLRGNVLAATVFVLMFGLMAWAIYKLGRKKK